MIRPFTCLCLLAAAGSGLYLYSSKHDAQMLEREIARLSHDAQDSRARAALLRAEYDRLGDPDRLRELAGQVLTLQPTDPKQFTSLAELERRLPAIAPPPVLDPPAPPVVIPIAAPPAEPTPKPPAPLPVVVADKPQAAPPRVAPPPRPTPTPIVQTAPVATTPPPTPPPTPLVPASVLAMAQSSVPRPLVPRASAAELHPTPAARTLAAVQPTPAPTPAPIPAPIPVPTAPRRAPAPVAPAAPYPNELIARSAPVIGSSLGMARSMAMPTPVSNVFGQTQR